MNLAWQIWAWWDYKVFCVPCAIVSMIAGFTLGNLHNWVVRSEVPSPKKLDFKAFAFIGFIAVICGISVFKFGSFPKNNFDQPNTTIGYSRENPITNLSQIGITSDPNYRITVIASTDCRSCQDLLEYLDQLNLQNIRYVSVVETLPDERHPWIVLANPRSIASTPIVIITDQYGKVTKMYDGFSREKVWLSEFTSGLTTAQSESKFP